MRRSNEFVCAICRGTFPLSAEDAAKANSEMTRWFGYIPHNDREMVCDDCWELAKPDEPQQRDAN